MEGSLRRKLRRRDAAAEFSARATGGYVPSSSWAEVQKDLVIYASQTDDHRHHAKVPMHTRSPFCTNVLPSSAYSASSGQVGGL